MFTDSQQRLWFFLSFRTAVPNVLTLILSLSFHASKMLLQTLIQHSLSKLKGKGPS